jgi:DNA modification methylase
LAELSEAGYDLVRTGFDDDELAKMLADLGDDDGAAPEQDSDPEADDEVPEPPKQPISRTGDVWQLGPHRLICGDASDPVAIATLMQGEQASLCFTSPPYGNQRDYTSGGIADWDGLMRGVFAQVPMAADGQVLVNLGLIHRDNEFILYGWPEGQNRHWCGDRDQGDVWNIKKPQKNDLHPTMKPVELVERAIRNSSRPGDIVLDPFGGSGTTLIAAEKSGRIGWLIELDPKYVDVIVRRWQDWSGQEAYRELDAVKFNDLAALAGVAVTTDAAEADA